MKTFEAGRLALILALPLSMAAMPALAQEASPGQEASPTQEASPGQEASPTQEASPALRYSGIDLSPGTEHAGELADFHPQMSDGTHADCFQLRPQPGMEYTVTLRSADFDSFLLVGVGNCDEVLIQFENDDFEDEGLDSQLVFAAEYDLYSVYVNTYDPGTTGNYSLSIEARLLPMAPAAD
ncbi:hypothetical protein [Pseudohongiella sp.]|nr:hypothetical protein [Pseudohongiella sp.]